VTIAVAGEMPGAGMRTPASLGGTPSAFHLSVSDVDAAWRRAIAAGATVFEPVHDAFWGDRTGQFLDPSGHRWALGQHVRDVSREEIARHAAQLLGGQAGS
jgi:PhnB protein